MHVDIHGSSVSSVKAFLCWFLMKRGNYGERVSNLDDYLWQPSSPKVITFDKTIGQEILYKHIRGTILHFQYFIVIYISTMAQTAQRRSYKSDTVVICTWFV